MYVTNVQGRSSATVGSNTSAAASGRDPSVRKNIAIVAPMTRMTQGVMAWKPKVVARLVKPL